MVHIFQPQCKVHQYIAHTETWNGTLRLHAHQTTASSCHRRDWGKCIYSTTVFSASMAEMLPINNVEVPAGRPQGEFALHQSHDRALRAAADNIRVARVTQRVKRSLSMMTPTSCRAVGTSWRTCRISCGTSTVQMASGNPPCSLGTDILVCTHCPLRVRDSWRGVNSNVHRVFLLTIFHYPYYLWTWSPSFCQTRWWSSPYLWMCTWIQWL